MSVRYLLHVGVVLPIVICSVTGSVVAALATYLILRNYFYPLMEFRRALDSIHRGAFSSVTAQPAADSTIGGVIRSVGDALNRLEDESLWHTAQILNFVEGERQRIGRELHDQASQTLATALVNLKLAENSLVYSGEDSRKRLATVKQLIEHGLEQIKACVYDLRPVMLDDLGLVPALRWYIKSHLTATGLTVTTDFEDAADRIPRDIETALYRVAQEALANVIKHARATRVSIRLETKKEYAVLSISDNGAGFDLDAAIKYKMRSEGGLGLSTIRERILLVRGSFNIRSKPGLGTQIDIVVPIPPCDSTDVSR